MTTLISFLGSAKLGPDGYRQASYRLDSGALVRTPYFGLSLAQELAPERMVVLGTGSSMWDVFLISQPEAPTPEQLKAQEILIDLRAAGEEISTELLARACPRLAGSSQTELVCRIIPYARDTAEQVAIIRLLAGCVTHGERVLLDVTHSFRHLPMLALAAARYLRLTKGVHVDSILYGALDMTDQATGETPVINLAGLLQIFDHVEALAVSDATGDFGALASVLAADGMRQSDLREIEDAAFLLRVANPEPAHRKIKGKVIPALKRHEGTLGALFTSTLVDRLRRFESNARWRWELAMADDALAHGDYLRCALNLQEAWVSKQLREGAEQGPDPASVNDYSRREEMSKHGRENQETFRRLGQLRNRLAHGERKRDPALGKFVESRALLEQELGRLRRDLFPAEHTKPRN